MKTRQLLLAVALGVMLKDGNARATTIDFIEGTTEGALVSVTYSSDWRVPTSSSTAESGHFTGNLLFGDIGNGYFNILLYEPGTTVLSDWVQVVGRTVPDTGPGGFHTEFDIVFSSDTDGQVLLPPPTSPFPSRGSISAFETGGLQTFDIGLGILVGIQSDVEQPHVPDEGATIALLGLAMAALGLAQPQRQNHFGSA